MDATLLLLEQLMDARLGELGPSVIPFVEDDRLFALREHL